MRPPSISPVRPSAAGRPAMRYAWCRAPSTVTVCGSCPSTVQRHLRVEPRTGNGGRPFPASLNSSTRRRAHWIASERVLRVRITGLSRPPWCSRCACSPPVEGNAPGHLAGGVGSCFGTWASLQRSSPQPPRCSGRPGSPPTRVHGAADSPLRAANRQRCGTWIAHQSRREAGPLGPNFLLTQPPLPRHPHPAPPPDDGIVPPDDRPCATSSALFQQISGHAPRPASCSFPGSGGKCRRHTSAPCAVPCPAVRGHRSDSAPRNAPAAARSLSRSRTLDSCHIVVIKSGPLLSGEGRLCICNETLR